MNTHLTRIHVLGSLLVAALLATRGAFAAFGFSPSAPLNSGAATDVTAGDEDPAIAADGAGVWVAVWSSNNSLGNTIGTDSDIFFARSTDNGATWSANALLNSYGDVDESGDFQPEVAGDGKGNWICVWHSGRNLGGVGTDNDVFASHSTDDGITWSDALVVNSNAATDGSAKAQSRTVP